MKKLLKNKNAEISTEQIVMLIILIVSFGIIIFFITRLSLGENSADQLCKNSVLNSATSPISGSTPLSCYREYVCITKDGTCDELTNPSKEKVKTLEEVYDILAEEMTSCWGVFGEGKIDYVGTDLTHNNYCSICSEIFFDDSLKELDGVENGKISKDGLYDYLINKQYSKEETYSEYLFGTNDLQGLKQQVSEENIILTNFGEIKLGGRYFVVMGIISETKDSWAVGVGTFTTIFGGLGLADKSGLSGFASKVVGIANPTGKVQFVIAVGAGVVAAGALAISDTINPEISALIIPGDGIGNQFVAPTIVEAEEFQFESLNCKEIINYA